MNQNESAQIVDFIYATRTTEPTEKTYGAWHLVLSSLPFELARDAAILALRDEDIRILEPKHVFQKASKIREQKDIAIRQQSALEAEETVEVGVPMPTCKHGKGLLSCDPCCHDEAVKQGLKSGPYVPRKSYQSLVG